jgi:membrane dipeptidase
MSRRELLQLLALGSTVAASGCARVTAEHRAAAERIVQGTVSVDLHSHPGLQPTSRRTVDQQLAQLGQGHVTACVFTVSTDRPVLGIVPGREIYATRTPEPGELYTYTYATLEPLFSRFESGGLMHVKTAADLDAAAAAGRRGAIVATEGGDFLEGRLERVQEAYDRGIRSIQLVHYRVNELGDIQTAAAVHNGLTPFGREVVREMNRLGMLVDLAHAHESGVRAAVDVSTNPMMISHTNLQNRSGWRRFVTAEHARLVTTHGGIIGAMPIAVGIDGMSGYIDEILRLIDAVGIDHVAIGTDMNGVLPPYIIFDDYAEWPSIGASLLARGVRADELGKVLGGNFRRVFQAVTAAQSSG